MLVHGVATVRAKSRPGNIQRLEMTNNFTFGELRGPIGTIDWRRFILGVITIFEPLRGFDENLLFTILGYLSSPPRPLQSGYR